MTRPTWILGVLLLSACSAGNIEEGSNGPEPARLVGLGATDASLGPAFRPLTERVARRVTRDADDQASSASEPGDDVIVLRRLETSLATERFDRPEIQSAIGSIVRGGVADTPMDRDDALAGRDALQHVAMLSRMPSSVDLGRSAISGVLTEGRLHQPAVAVRFDSRADPDRARDGFQRRDGSARPALD